MMFTVSSCAAFEWLLQLFIQREIWLHQSTNHMQSTRVVVIVLVWLRFNSTICTQRTTMENECNRLFGAGPEIHGFGVLSQFQTNERQWHLSRQILIRTAVIRSSSIPDVLVEPIGNPLCTCAKR